MRNIFIFFFGLIALMNISCKSKSNTNILSLDSMKVVMWDMLAAGEWNNIAITKDSALFRNHNDIKLYEQVFLVHHITKDQFYNSYKYYQSHPDKMKILVDSVSNFGTREKTKAFKIHY